MLFRRFFSSLKLFDDKGVDGTVNGVADSTIATGRVLSKTQTGQLQLYGVFIILGILAISLTLFFSS